MNEKKKKKSKSTSLTLQALICGLFFFLLELVLAFFFKALFIYFFKKLYLFLIKLSLIKWMCGILNMTYI